MFRFATTSIATVGLAAICVAQSSAPQPPPLKVPIPRLKASHGVLNVAPPKPTELVELELMTHPEIYDAIHKQGKTTAIVFTGGIEQRGPQCVLGGHTLMARETARQIALKLGNALVAPVLPFTPNNASANLPGTIGLTPDLLSLVLERVAEQLIANEFKTVLLMGDHGGGQPAAYKAVADKLEAKYAPQGVHVYYIDDVYTKAANDFDKWLADNNYPRSSHAGIPDTAEMLYLGGDAWVRRDKITYGDPVPEPGQGGRGRGQDPNAPPRINNGISGDARPSTPELGKRVFDMKVAYAVAQIQKVMGGKGATQR